MKKILMILTVGVLIISGIGAQAISVENTNNISAETITETIEIDFSSLKVADNDKEYVTVCLGDDELYLMNPGQPMIPRVLKKFELPFGATNIKIEANPSYIQELEISKEIIPASAPLPLTPRPDSVIRSQKDETVYNSDEYYPHDWSSFHVGCGLNNNAKRVTHLTINIFPPWNSGSTRWLSVLQAQQDPFRMTNPKSAFRLIINTFLNYTITMYCDILIY